MGRQIVLPALTPAQATVATNAARFRVVACGRRWGKTFWGSGEACISAAAGGRVWWIGPSYKQAQEGWGVVKWIARQLPGCTIREAEREVIFPGGGRVEIKTADDPNRLRGSGLDLAILDEAAYMGESVWADVVRPALVDRKGRAIFISTPRGRNWFHDLWLRGMSGMDGWASFQFPTESNPNLDRAELLALRAESPDRVQREEFDADFIEDGGVFRRVRDCSTAPIAEPVVGAEYVTFADLGFDDFNAVAVFRIDGVHRKRPTQVYADRWNREGWPVSRARIAGTGKRYPGVLAIDATKETFRDNLASQLRSDLAGRCRVFPVRFNAANKETAVLGFAGALEAGSVELLHPDSCPAALVQLRELSDFQATRTALGNVRYAAPSGKNDDMAIAVLTAHAIVKEGRGSGATQFDRVTGGSVYY
ncbi:MAG: terminase family protein [bacterium]